MNQTKKQKLPMAAVCFLFLVMAVFMGFHLNTEAAEERYTVVMKGTRSYSGAYEVLDLVNEERKKAGLEPLTMDEKLLEYAMRRAMECKLEFSHTRTVWRTCTGNVYLEQQQSFCDQRGCRRNGESAETGKCCDHSQDEKRIRPGDFQHCGVIQKDGWPDYFQPFRCHL